MAYVTLDSSGAVTGVFSAPQPQLNGYAEIDDADLRIATFLNSSAAPPAPTLAELQSQLNALAAQLVRLSGGGGS